MRNRVGAHPQDPGTTAVWVLTHLFCCLLADFPRRRRRRRERADGLARGGEGGQGETTRLRGLREGGDEGVAVLLEVRK
jgi:hypothetical protein